MMGIEKAPQGKLFYMNLNMEGRVRTNHPLRRIASLVDFDFVYKAVQEKYGNNGNESEPHGAILKQENSMKRRVDR